MACFNINNTHVSAMLRFNPNRLLIEQHEDKLQYGAKYNSNSFENTVAKSLQFPTSLILPFALYHRDNHRIHTQSWYSLHTG